MKEPLVSKCQACRHDKFFFSTSLLSFQFQYPASHREDITSEPMSSHLRSLPDRQRNPETPPRGALLNWTQMDSSQATHGPCKRFLGNCSIYFDNYRWERLVSRLRRDRDDELTARLALGYCVDNPPSLPLLLRLADALSWLLSTAV